MGKVVSVNPSNKYWNITYAGMTGKGHCCSYWSLILVNTGTSCMLIALGGTALLVVVSSDNTIQLYCPHWEIPLAAIWSQWNVKRHMNMIYLRLKNKNKQPQQNTHSRRACQDWNTLTKSLAYSIHLPTHIYDNHIHPRTPPFPPPTNTITYEIRKIV